MKSISFLGLILLAVSALLFYLTMDFSVEKIALPHIMGLMAGVGIGLIIGGMVGYVSKGSAVKAEQKRREINQLRKEKEALEKQAADLAKQQNMPQNTNPQNYY